MESHRKGTATADTKTTRNNPAKLTAGFFYAYNIPYKQRKEKTKMIKDKINDLLNNIIEDENDPTRRHFRAWITGAYDESMYHRNMERIKNCHTYRKLKSFVIEQFTCFIAFESGCSYNHAQKCIVNYYNNLNNKFAEDWKSDHLNALTCLLMEEIDQTYVELNPDCNRAPVTEAGENALV